MVPGGFLAEGAPTCEDVPTFGDTVITSRPEPIRHFVTETLGRTATQQDATGVYTGEPRTMIMVALTRRQAGLLPGFPAPGGSPRRIAQNTPGKFYLNRIRNQYIIGSEINCRKG